MKKIIIMLSLLVIASFFVTDTYCKYVVNQNKYICTINFDKIPPELDISYNITELTNENVIVTITSDEILEELDGFALSKDKLSLAKEYDENVNKIVSVKDSNNNYSNIEINIENIDKEPPTININSLEVGTNYIDLLMNIEDNEEIVFVTYYINDVLIQEFYNLYSCYYENLIHNKKQKIKIVATDIAGNISKWEQDIYTKELIPATMNFVSYYYDEDYNEITMPYILGEISKYSLQYTLNKTENARTTYSVRTNDYFEEDCWWSFNYHHSAGQTIIKIKTTDGSNTVYREYDNIFIDNIPPIILVNGYLEQPMIETYTGDEFTVTFEIFDYETEVKFNDNLTREMFELDLIELVDYKIINENTVEVKYRAPHDYTGVGGFSISGEIAVDSAGNYADRRVFNIRWNPEHLRP